VNVRRSLFAACIVILWTVSGCGNDPFYDFRGVNLISGSFSDPAWAVDPSDTYMTFEASGESFTDGTPAYRLEINNLFSNGDFEASAAGTQPPNWAPAGPGAASDAYSVAANGIQGNSLSFNIASNQDRLSFDLAAGSGDGLMGLTYIVKLDFNIAQNQLALSYNDGGKDNTSWKISATNDVTLPFPPQQDPPNPEFSVESPAAGQFYSVNTVDASAVRSGYVDNIRMVRTDIPVRLRCVVQFSSAGRPDLVPGRYKFTIFVKNDSTVTPVTANRFPARGVSIAVDGASDGSFSYIESPALALPTDTGADWSGWTEVSGTFMAASIPDTSLPDSPMLQLSISPTDVSNAYTYDVGSILIAGPRLEFIP
jgi:hypothetical protein